MNWEIYVVIFIVCILWFAAGIGVGRLIELIKSKNEERQKKHK